MFQLLVFNLRLYLIGILITIIIYKLIIYFWDRRYLYYYSSKMRGPFNWPIIGYGWKFLGTNQDMFHIVKNFCNIYEPPSTLWLGPELYFVITDPRHYEIILNSSKTLDKASVYEFFRSAFGNGLLTAPPDKWKRHRKMIQPTFNQKILNNFVQIFSEQSKMLVKDLDEFAGKRLFDVFPVFSKLSMTVACHTILGYKVLSKEQITKCFTWLNTGLQLVNYRMFKVWYHPDMLWNLTPSSKKLTDCSRNLSNLIKEIVVQKRKTYKPKQKQVENFDNIEGDSKWKGFLDYAVETLDKTGRLTDNEIVDEATVLLIGGTDTTAATNSFCMLLLALHPEIQDKVYDELYSIFGSSDRAAEVADLNKMVYLEYAIKETMRLCTTIPIISRKLDEDIYLKSHILPKGSKCVLAFHETHRNPKIWENPQDFDPDRFLPEEVAKRHPYAFIPFSGGPRNCIGLKYAMMFMKAVLSTILRTYKVSTNYKTISDIKFSQALILRAADGFNIALDYRK